MSARSLTATRHTRSVLPICSYIQVSALCWHERSPSPMHWILFDSTLSFSPHFPQTPPPPRCKRRTAGRFSWPSHSARLHILRIALFMPENVILPNNSFSFLPSRNFFQYLFSEQAFLSTSQCPGCRTDERIGSFETRVNRNHVSSCAYSTGF